MTKIALVLVGGEMYEAYETVAGVFNNKDLAIEYVNKYREKLKCDGHYEMWYVTVVAENPTEFVNPYENYGVYTEIFNL